MSLNYYSDNEITSIKKSLVLPKISRIEPPSSVEISSLGLADIPFEADFRTSPPSQYTRTFNGIRWEEMNFFLSVKFFIGFGAMLLYRDLGKFPMGIDTQEWLAENTIARFPNLPEEFDKHLLRPASLGEALVHRARFAGIRLPNGRGEEILKFRDDPVWSPTLEAMLNAWSDPSIVFNRRRLFELRESGLIVICTNKPGVYVRQNPDCPEQIYLGVALKDMVGRGCIGRAGDHRNLVAGYIFPSSALADQCEDVIHRILRNEQFRYGIKEIPMHTRGPYTFKDGVDGEMVIRRLMRLYFSKYSRRSLLPIEREEK